MKSSLSFCTFHFGLILCLCPQITLSVSRYCWKWVPIALNGILARPRFLKNYWAGSTCWICPKEISFKYTIVHCALRIFSIHLSVLYPESSLHMCSPEKDMKGQYSFGSFPWTSSIHHAFPILFSLRMWAQS